MNSAFLRRVKLEREKVTAWDKYPFNITAIRDLDETEFHPRVTFIVGENGAGKSTLIEAIAIAAGLAADGGNKDLGGGSQHTHSGLNQCIRLVKGWKYPKSFYYLRAESFYNVAAVVDSYGGNLVGSYGGVGLHEQSHGESFISLLTHKFKPNGFYILDEPEAALSPARQLVALRRIHDLVQQGSQFLIATHSPILMAYLDAMILSCSKERGLHPISYKETEHYMITRNFLNYPEQAMETLLQDKPEPPRQWRGIDE